MGTHRSKVNVSIILCAMLFAAPSARGVEILANDADFQSSPTTFINFEDITPLCSPPPCTTFFSVSRYQSLGVHISDGTSSDCVTFTCSLTGTSTAAAFDGTVGGMASGCQFSSCPVSPHSGVRGIADSDGGIPGGCVVIRFVTPGTATPTSVFEAGIWVHGGKEADCVQFLDAGQTVLTTLVASADAWQFLGVRATEGIRFIRFTGTSLGLPQGGGYLIDDLKFGGSPPAANNPPVITQGASANLSVGCNSNCPLAANNITLNATDTETPSASLSWSIMTSPTRGTLSPTTGTGAAFTTCYDPNNMQTMADSFVVKVTDGGGATDTITVNVTVSNNTPNITQGTTINRTVLRNSSCGCPACPDTANIIAFNGTDTETPVGSLQWTVPTPPATGTVCFENGVQTGGAVAVRYTPNPNQQNADSFVVRVADDCGATRSATVNITVNAACTSVERGDLNMDGLVDGRDIQRFCSVVITPSTATAVEKCRTDVGAADPNFCAPDGAVTVNDITGFTLILLGGVCNVPPVITQGAATSLMVSANTDCPLPANNLTLNATDADGPLGSLSWSIQSQPASGTLTPQSGTGGAFTLCYDPTNGQAAADSFVVRVTDAFGAADTIIVNVTVDNQPPVITQGASTGLPVGLNTDCPNAANNLTLNATDPDGAAASLSWSIMTQPATGAVTPQTGTGGAFTLCYDPNNGQSAADSFVVRVTDVLGGVDTIQVNVTVANLPPVITEGDTFPKTVQVNSNCPNVGNNVAVNATDPDGSAAALSWSIQTQPARGSVSPQSGTGASFTTCYDPNNDQNLADSFVIKVSDPSGAMDTITVNVTLNNSAPVITQGASTNLAVGLNTNCPNAANNVTLGATDSDGTLAILSWSIQTQPLTGVLSPQNGTGGSFIVCYDPNNGQMAADSFVVRVTDQFGATDTILVNVTVADNPPVITQGASTNMSVEVNSFCGFPGNELTLNATDETTASLAWSIQTQPLHGFLSPTTGSGASFVLCYEPDPEQCQADSFVVRVQDAGGQSDTITVNVTVIDTPPDITVGVGGQLFLQVTRNSNCPSANNQVTITASDPDSATLTWSIMTQPATGVVTPQSGSGTSFVPCYDPNQNQQASDSYVVKVSDSCGASDTIMVIVTVVP